MSLLGKKWEIGEEGVEALIKRNLDDETVMFHDPFLMPDMKKATERLKKAIEGDERILIFGDYDVDGISGTALMVQTFRELGANVSYRLPNRQDGYGINAKWIDEFVKVKVDVLITVDCGVSNRAEIETAQAAGIDVIITDHHTLPDPLPDAYAILHPHLPNSPYPFHYLSGSAVAFKLGVGLMELMRGKEASLDWRQKIVDLASLGTVADCVPLVGENRWITREGIDQMKKSHWKGLKVLLKKAGVEEIQGHDSDVIGFKIGPRINAAGRLETPYFSLQLLLDENGSAHSLADKLEEMNNMRREMVASAIEEAEAQVAEKNLLDHKIIIAWSKDWPAGIIGLIAARLSEKYHRPTIVLEQRDTKLVASCRSPEGFNIVDALRNSKDRFITYGGHAAAAGFSVELDQLPHLVKELQIYTNKTLSDEDLIPVLTIDHRLSLSDLSFELLDELTRLEPFGQSNLRPKFILEDIDPIDLQTVGREHSHLRFRLNAGKSVSAIAFRFGSYHQQIQEAYLKKQKLDVVFELEKNVWKGNVKLQIRVIDVGIRD
jgi:single-stranded-DNA-specific exonuclease